MKRLVAIPLASLCACTITVAPIRDKPRTYWNKQASRHKTETTAKPAPKPDITPIINKVHEQYKPIYEKLPNPQAPRSQVTPDSGP